jgi:hypothetical protein
VVRQRFAADVDAPHARQLHAPVKHRRRVPAQRTRMMRSK